jgi:hypothetical protein
MLERGVSYHHVLTHDRRVRDAGGMLTKAFTFDSHSPASLWPAPSHIDVP